MIVNHMEPDHCGTIGALVSRYPDIRIVCNSKIAGMMKQFFDFDVDSMVQIVEEGDTFSTGTPHLRLRRPHPWCTGRRLW